MAATGRIYTANFQNVTIAAAQDLFSIVTPAGRVIALLSLNLGQITGAAIANQRVRIQRAASTVVGSGGATVAGNPWIENDAATTCTIRANDTVQSVASFTDLWDDQWNILNGFLWMPPTINRPPMIAPSHMFRFSLDGPIASSVVANGSLTYEEFP